MIECQRVDLRALQMRGSARRNLSAPQDDRWVGIQVLAPLEIWDLPTGARHDLYVLQGCLLECGARRASGSFFSRSQALSLTADTNGAMVLHYRDNLARTSAHETWDSTEMIWWHTQVHGMQVAALSKFHHRVALVAWQAGTHAAPHTHPHGEEIFVMSGELRDERGAYPAGSWLRFHPGSGHAPFAEQETLILLRNGHLST